MENSDMTTTDDTPTKRAWITPTVEYRDLLDTAADAGGDEDLSFANQNQAS